MTSVIKLGGWTFVSLNRDCFTLKHDCPTWAGFGAAKYLYSNKCDFCNKSVPKQLLLFIKVYLNA